jgi:putative endonuclease
MGRYPASGGASHRLWRGKPPPLAGQATGADCHRLQAGCRQRRHKSCNFMLYYTYILQSQKNYTYYTGSCKNIDIRLNRHNKGQVKSTKNKRPYKLVYIEEFNSRSEAYGRELQIKSYKGGEAFKRLVN